jgi:hypothetical protein
VQEHRLTLPEIGRWLDILHLDFLGFELSSSGIARDYLTLFPDDPTMRRLGNWERFEEEHRGTFSGMYLFWARDPDGPRADQSATG